MTTQQENKNQQAGIELRLSALKKDYAEKVNDIQRRRTALNEEYVKSRENIFGNAREYKSNIKAGILDIDKRLCEDITNEERIKLKKSRIQFQYDIEKANESRDALLSEIYRKYNTDVHILDEESRQIKERHESQRIDILNEYEVARRTSHEVDGGNEAVSA